MKIKVVSVVAPKGSERLNFEFVNEQNQSGCCFPSLRFLQDNPSFGVKPGDELLVGDSIPDLIMGTTMPVLFPNFIRKLGISAN